jgi:nitrous oxidase accessory protein
MNLEKFFSFFIIWFLLWSPGLTQLFGRTHTVINGNRISDHIQNASPGDTISIGPGEYIEQLVIDKSLTIIGQQYPHIRGEYQGHVIVVQAPNSSIEGLKISEAGTRLIDDFACILIETDSISINNNIITRPLHGIYVKGGNHILITNNRIEGRLDLISADRGNGIHLWNSKHNRLYRNVIFDVRDGIYFSFASNTEVDENHIYNVRYGLHYMYSDENIFTNNLFENSVAGAALMYSEHILFEKNVFANCRGFRAYGILYQSMDHTTAINNLIIDNSRGVFFDNCNDNHFINNVVVDNDLAMQMMGSGENNTIHSNNFINNLGNLVVDSKNSEISWANEKGGNHWSDYKGYDLDGDGLGDVPHKIQSVFQVLETDIPEVRYYLNSPAAEILEMAERTLPILSLGTENDPSPLFRPQDNQNIPWTKTHQLQMAGSSTLAITFLLCGFIPFILLLYLSRKRGR